MRYEIHADEAWTHGGDINGGDIGRYWCFYGGLFGTSTDLDRLSTSLLRVKAAFGAKGEVKWGKLNATNEPLYLALVECLFAEIEKRTVRFRQMFCDRALVRVSDGVEAAPTDLDVQFKLCYQFLKHAFGIKYLPPAEVGSRHELLIRLDQHSSQRHQKRLANFAEAVPRLFDRSDLDVKVTFHRSTKMPLIQVCDLLIGAAGSHGNRMAVRRQPGQRGMTEKQRLRDAVCRKIYEHFRAWAKRERGAGAFNWFETTGKDGDWTNFLEHGVRIWKFRPKKYVVDCGWQNANLDKQGRYSNPDIVTTTEIADDIATY